MNTNETRRADDASVRDDVLARLKRATRSDHAALEAALDLLSDRLDRASYRRCLERLYGFFVPLEDAIHAVGGWRERGLDLTARRKGPLLLADLRALGHEAPELLPRCARDLPREPAAAFGALYVLEGSTLGGRVVHRRLRATLDVGPDSGGSFFCGYGARTGEMWSSFRAALITFAEADRTDDRVVGSAVRTFADLRRWFEEG